MATKKKTTARRLKVSDLAMRLSLYQGEMEPWKQRHHQNLQQVQKAILDLQMWKDPTDKVIADNAVNMRNAVDALRDDLTVLQTASQLGVPQMVDDIHKLETYRTWAEESINKHSETIQEMKQTFVKLADWLENLEKISIIDRKGCEERVGKIYDRIDHISNLYSELEKRVATDRGDLQVMLNYRETIRVMRENIDKQDKGFAGRTAEMGDLIRRSCDRFEELDKDISQRIAAIDKRMTDLERRPKEPEPVHAPPPRNWATRLWYAWRKRRRLERIIRWRERHPHSLTVCSMTNREIEAMMFGDIL